MSPFNMLLLRQLSVPKNCQLMSDRMMQGFLVCYLVSAGVVLNEGKRSSRPENNRIETHTVRSGTDFSFNSPLFPFVASFHIGSAPMVVRKDLPSIVAAKFKNTPLLHCWKSQNSESNKDIFCWPQMVYIIERSENASGKILSIAFPICGLSYTIC